MNEAEKKWGTKGRGQKLLYLLGQLEEEEREELEQFLESPLLGNRPQLAAWVRRIFQCVPDLSQGRIEPQFFADESYVPREGYVWVRISQLQQEVLRFLAFQAYRQRPALSRELLLRSLHERNAHQHFFPKLLDQALQSIPQPSPTDPLLDRLQLELIRQDHAAQVPSAPPDLAPTLEALEQFYLVQKFKIVCAGFSQHLFGGTHPEFPALDALIQLAHAQAQQPLLAAYLQAVLLLRAALQSAPDSDPYFHQLKSLLFQPDQLSHRDQSDLFAIAQNYAVWRFRQGHQNYLHELTQLYEGFLASGAAFEGHDLNPVFYKNTVMLFCRMGEVGWAEDFVETYRDRISQDPERLNYAYNRAVVAFFRGDFAKVVDLLYNKIPRFSQVSMVLAARSYFCRALWMQGDFEWLLDALKGFAQYLRRNAEVSKADKQRYRNYIRRFRQLVLVVTGSPGGKKKRLEKLLGEMEKEGQQAVFNWLWRRAQELKEGPPPAAARGGTRITNRQ